MNEQNQSILSFSHIVFDELSFKRIGFRQPDEQEIQTTIGCTVRAFAPNQYGVTLTQRYYHRYYDREQMPDQRLWNW